jgi:hypothetical protein
MRRQGGGPGQRKKQSLRACSKGFHMIQGCHEDWNHRLNSFQFTSRPALCQFHLILSIATANALSPSPGGRAPAPVGPVPHRALRARQREHATTVSSMNTTRPGASRLLSNICVSCCIGIAYKTTDYGRCPRFRQGTRSFCRPGAPTGRCERVRASIQPLFLPQSALNGRPRFLLPPLNVLGRLVTCRSSLQLAHINVHTLF